MPLNSSGIRKPEVRSQKPELLLRRHSVVGSLKLFEKLYAPLTTSVMDPVSGDANLPGDRISNLDKLYLAVSTALDNLLEGVGLEAT